jgi:hypothetical protein
MKILFLKKDLHLMPTKVTNRETRLKKGEVLTTMGSQDILLYLLQETIRFQSSTKRDVEVQKE